MFAGRNERKQLAKALQQEGLQVAVFARYLGPHLSTQVDGYAYEVSLRQRAASVAWARLRGFWYSSAKKNLKRRAFYSTVYTAALSGLTAATISEHLLKKLDRQLANYMRKMLKGEATWLEEGAQRLKALAQQELRLYWCLPTVADELRSQRLKSLYKVLQEPTHHKQYIATVFGKFTWEKTTQWTRRAGYPRRRQTLL